MQEDKIMPNDKELEKSVIGELLMFPENIEKLDGFLKPAAFYNLGCQKIYSALLTMNKKGKEVDLLSLTQELKPNGILEQIGGPVYLSQLMKNVASDTSLMQHAKYLIQLQKKREAIALGYELINKGHNDAEDIFDLLSSVENKIYDIQAIDVTTNKNHQQKVQEHTKESIKLMKKLHDEEKVIGVKTGYAAIDQITSGLMPGELIIVAGRPGMGKSVFAGCLARNCDGNSGIFTQEMQEKMFYYRLLSNDLSINHDKFRSGNFSDEEIEKMFPMIDLYSEKIFILNKPGISIELLRKQAHKWKKENDIKVLIVDYLQLVRASGDTRENEISNVSKGLKEIAEELDLPVVALAQLSRATEGKADRIPNLTHLRESGSIEQDADMVLFIWRPEYYMKDEDLEDAGYLKDETHIICAKFRSGNSFTVKLSFEGQYQRFKDFEDIYPKYKDKSSSDWIGNVSDDEDEVQF